MGGLRNSKIWDMTNKNCRQRYYYMQAQCIQAFANALHPGFTREQRRVNIFVFGQWFIA